MKCLACGSEAVIEGTLMGNDGFSLRQECDVYSRRILNCLRGSNGWNKTALLLLNLVSTRSNCVEN